MYPFERFTERAKRVLTFAQQEAEASQHSYIGTEHLLIALLREGEGLAAHGLKNLGVEIAAVRKAIAEKLSRGPEIGIQQIIPTSRVKKVVELSFEEARRMGHTYVGTEHLLLGILIEGEGIAAHVLVDLGVTLDAARAEIGRLLAEAPPEPILEMQRIMAGGPPARSMLPEVRFLLLAASAQAVSRGASGVGLDHLLDAMISSAGMEALARLLDVRRIVAAKEQAIAAQDYDTAGERRTEEMGARQALEQAIAAWREELQPPASSSA